jgi:hypothetical protein
MIDPEHRAGVVVLTNMDSLDPDQLALEIMKMLLGKDPPAK